ncbi:hypothetical protein BB560_004730, partial [Smittium megazygosporum]
MAEKPVSKNSETKNTLFHTLSVKEAESSLLTDISSGLSDEQASKKLEKYGQNSIRGEGGVSVLKILLRQITNVMTFILVAAAVLSFIIKDFAEGIVLIIIIIINVTIGFFQEYKAEKTVESLRKLASPTSRVLRNGHLNLVSTINVVPGDILYFESGDVIGADCRLFEALNFETDEALLTGEALPVLKTVAPILESDCPLGDRTNIGYSSTVVTKGRAKGIVFATGMNSEVGKIAVKLMETSDSEKTRLNRSLDRMTYYCLGIAILLVLLVFAINKFKIKGEVLIYSVSLAIAVIPEGLPAVLTLAMSMGVARMSKQRALVRQLKSLEVLGSITDICSDKTGTLTQAKMVLVRCWIPDEGDFGIHGLGFEPLGEVHKITKKDSSDPENCDKESIFSQMISLDQFSDTFVNLAKAAALCNMSEIKQDSNSGEWYGIGDPTEIALQVFANKVGYGKQLLTTKENAWTTECEFSFDSTVKRMTVVVKRSDGQRVAFMKGATERVVESCKFAVMNSKVTEIHPNELFEIVEPHLNEVASDGLRVISLCYRYIKEGELNGSPETWNREDIEKEMTYLGLVGIYDPPRPESKMSVEKCFRAGIMVRMLTGDHPATAKAIAREIGIIPDK